MQVLCTDDTGSVAGEGFTCNAGFTLTSGACEPQIPLAVASNAEVFGVYKSSIEGLAGFPEGGSVSSITPTSTVC
jgi:hypothetical protein